MSDKNPIGMGQAAISAGGGLLSTILSNRAARKENEKTREYNLKLAQMQNQWNVEQWQRENAYNSPSAQLQRLQDAGINPDLIYGGGISNTSASSPQMTAGSAASPTPLVGMPNIVGDYLDAQLKQAQIDNINANTKKQGAETSILSDDAACRKALNEGILALQNLEIKFKGIQGAIGEQSIKESQKRMQVMESQIQSAASQIQRWFDQTSNERRQLDLSEKELPSRIKYANSSANLADQQAYNLAEQLDGFLRELDSKIRVNDTTADLNIAREINLGNQDVGLTYSNGVLKLKYDLATDSLPLKDVDDFTNFITRYIMAVFGR